MMKIFLDSADLPKMVSVYQSRLVQGFTTNPTLMQQAGVKDYAAFAQLTLKEIPDLPISFEVLSNDLMEMEREAKLIASWGENVYVKIPIVTSKNESCLPLIWKLNQEGIKLNITAVYMDWQVKAIRKHIERDIPAIVSVFAGRIADIGIDPVPVMKQAKDILDWGETDIELLWASCREVYNIKQAERCGCDIITVPYTLLLKTSFFGKDVNKLSLETVRGFTIDTVAAGYKL